MADVTEELKEKVSPDGGSGSPLKGKLLPALATAAAAGAAGLAAKKGPDLLKKLSGQADDEAEALGGKALEGAKQQLASGGLMGKAASKLIGRGDDDDTGGGGKKTRRLPIQRWVDVAVPVEKAYEAWTSFEKYPEFMHRVLDVKQEGDDKIHWQEKIWFSSREWGGEITDRRENERIAWKTVSGSQHSGIISFHTIGENLTRVMVTVDFVPQGMVEKMASGLRFVKRAVQADLARFKAYVEMEDAEGLEYKSKPAEMEQHRDGEGGDEHSADDEQRSAEREERESRREERRKALSAS